jgi:hypothetical protein
MTKQAYIQNKGKVISKNSQFKHVMALCLNTKTNHRNGLLRCITSRKGNVKYKGFVDKSKLFIANQKSLRKYKITKKLKIEKHKKIIRSLGGKNWEFLGLEDPDIWHDTKNDLIHVYFTIPYKNHLQKKTIINLGHAVGRTLNSLRMTPPVLTGSKDSKDGGAKELSIVPVNKCGLRYNLIESSKLVHGTRYSVVQIAVAEDMGSSWEYGDILFNPGDENLSWIAGHASPGPLLPKSFINIGKNKRVGVINGREKNQKFNGKTEYGQFSVGLFIYDYQKGKIDWVSSEPLISDTDAQTITFASEFVQTKNNEGILYAHVDDSFVRAYTLFADKIKKKLPISKVQT